MTCAFVETPHRIPNEWPIGFSLGEESLDTIRSIVKVRISLFVHCIRFVGLMSHDNIHETEYLCRCAIDAHLPLLNTSFDLEMDEVYRLELEPESISIISQDTLPVLGSQLVRVWDRGDPAGLPALLVLLNKAIPKARRARMFWDDVKRHLNSLHPLCASLVMIIKCCLLGNYEHLREPIDLDHRWKIYQLSIPECASLIEDYSKCNGIEYILQEYIAHQHTLNPEVGSMMDILIDLPQFTAMANLVCSNVIRTQYRRGTVPTRLSLSTFKCKRSVPVKFYSARPIVAEFVENLKWLKETKKYNGELPLECLASPCFSEEVMAFLGIEHYYDTIKNVTHAEMSAWSAKKPPPIPLDVARIMYRYALSWVQSREFYFIPLPKNIVLQQKKALEANMSVCGKLHRWAGHVAICRNCLCIRGSPTGWKPPKKKINTIGICFETDVRYCMTCSSILDMVSIVGRILVGRIFHTEKTPTAVVLCIQCGHMHCSENILMPCVGCRASATQTPMTCYCGEPIRRKIRSTSFIVETPTELVQLWACQEHTHANFKQVVSEYDMLRIRQMLLNRPGRSKVKEMGHQNGFNTAARRRFDRQGHASKQMARKASRA